MPLIILVRSSLRFSFLAQAGPGGKGFRVPASTDPVFSMRSFFTSCRVFEACVMALPSFSLRILESFEYMNLRAFLVSSRASLDGLAISVIFMTKLSIVRNMFSIHCPTTSLTVSGLISRLVSRAVESPDGMLRRSTLQSACWVSTVSDCKKPCTLALMSILLRHRSTNRCVTSVFKNLSTPSLILLAASSASRRLSLVCMLTDLVSLGLNRDSANEVTSVEIN
mmetsp:Transcript_33438/g.76401  ORF Transcript_33438/g.76401 Transcript_33438/m.76401 type:complete len:224 (+) Transcript_33438:322-993(+)